MSAFTWSLAHTFPHMGRGILVGSMFPALMFAGAYCVHLAYALFTHPKGMMAVNAYEFFTLVLTVVTIMLLTFFYAGLVHLGGLGLGRLLLARAPNATMMMMFGALAGGGITWFLGHGIAGHVGSISIGMILGLISSALFLYASGFLKETF